MEQEQQLIREIKKSLLNWYEFKEKGVVLYIGDKEEPLAELLVEHSLDVVYATIELTCDSEWAKEYLRKFDYIISIESLELQLEPEKVLASWRLLLKLDGRMLLGMNNRLGIRYFCGDRDIYTERSFDGVEGYRRAYSKNTDVFRGRTYSSAELKRMLKYGGWEQFKFYSVFSDLNHPNLIYAEDCLPNEDLANRVTPVYHYPGTVFLEEEGLYGTLVENGMFHNMANAYLIECSPSGMFSDMMHVTSSMERGEEHALLTIIRKSGIVEKRAAYKCGEEKLQHLVEHGNQLKEHGIAVVHAKMEHGIYTMPYVEAEVTQLYLKRLFHTDMELFLQEMDRFRDLILQSSEIVKPDMGDGQGAVLKKGYPDMVPLNSFFIDGIFTFYDQEFCLENYPANAIIYRMVTSFYFGDSELQKKYPIERLYERYNLFVGIEYWRELEWELFGKLRNSKTLRNFHEKHWRNMEVVNANRQSINYSEEEYRRLFVDIFKNADSRKLILFGSGNFAKKFLALYAMDYPVYAIIDNNEQVWGQQLEGFTIQSPSILQEMDSGEYKVIICIKNYLSVMKQLQNLGVTDYSIYDTYKDYPRKRKPIIQVSKQEEAKESKKYHVGYVAGVFDLFHVGHLNMFKRAKEQCEYLIVGVVTDEGVRKFKKTEPFIPFEERIEMVRSCRYVDEAVEIPVNYGGIRDAYRLHHFDVQFSGSDYVDNPDWLADREFLRKHGSDMVFFPYTEQTSSTKIKALIEQKLS